MRGLASFWPCLSFFIIVWNQWVGCDFFRFLGWNTKKNEKLEKSALTVRGGPAYIRLTNEDGGAARRRHGPASKVL
ncbi:MAG: hypothetical protein K5863_14900, partial [Nitratireductor sp.]|uniref:hypothetical protein n=1 Tax=Nitratireductor sp. TaxID=1872084 RepID=UPI002626824B